MAKNFHFCVKLQRRCFSFWHTNLISCAKNAFYSLSLFFYANRFIFSQIVSTEKTWLLKKFFIKREEVFSICQNHIRKKNIFSCRCLFTTQFSHFLYFRSITINVTGKLLFMGLKGFLFFVNIVKKHRKVMLTFIRRYV